MPKYSRNEIELAKHSAEGDEAAFSELYQRYRDRVYAFAYRMVGVQAIAEDVTQEAFMVLIEHPERYQPDKGSMLTFLCAIARNQIMYYLRRNGRQVEVESEQFTNAVESQQKVNVSRDALTQLLDEELAAEINTVINSLPPLQREVILLREFQELSYEEIATVTDVDVNVVKARLHRARQSMEQRLTPYLVPHGETSYDLR